MILFGVVILLGGVGSVMTSIISGPAQGIGNITRHTLSETDLAGAAKIIGASARATVGDCDADEMIEPLPSRDPAGAPAPIGGGLMPEGTPAPTRDQWKRPIGYCAWDHGASTVSDDVPECGGNAVNRLNGGDVITEYVIALISAGADGAFQTTCRDFVDGNSDGAPDQALVEKAPGSDDVVLAFTYGELFAAGEGGTTGSIGPQPDEACTPETAGLLRDEMDTIQVCTSDGWEEVGASVSADNFTPVTGAQLSSAHTSNPITFSGYFGTRTASVSGGAIIEVNGVSIGPNATIAPGDQIALIATAADEPETERVFTFSISSIDREWRITTRDKYPAALSIAPGTVSGMNVAGPGSPAFGSPVSFTVTNTGEADTAAMQAAVLSNTTNFQFYVGGGHLGDNCNGRTLGGGDTCQIAVRPRASDDGALSGTLTVSDGTVSDYAALSGTATEWSCTVSAGTIWSVAGKTCTAPSALTIASGNTGTATDSTAPTTGSATYSCSGGAATLTTSSCVERCSVAAGTTWTMSGKTCTAPSALTIDHGASATSTDSTAPTTGAKTFTCTNGVVGQSGTPTCVESCTANQTVTWSTNCSAPSGALLANGASRTITNTASGYTGTRSITCNNGTISQSGGSCEVEEVATTSLVYTTTGNIVMDYPSGISAGDVLLFSAVTEGNGASIGVPPGFTDLGGGVNTGGTDTIWRYAYKIASGSESGSITITKRSSYHGVSQITAVKGVTSLVSNAQSKYTGTGPTPWLTSSSGSQRVYVYVVQPRPRGTQESDPSNPVGFDEVYEVNTPSSAQSVGVRIEPAGSGSNTMSWTLPVRDGHYYRFILQ